LSVSIALIPVGLAIASAIAAPKEAKAEGKPTMAIQTRMRDDEILLEALRDLGCEAQPVDGGGLSAIRGAFEFTFRRDENGVLEANFGAEVTPEEAEAFVTDLDDEYTRLIQARVYQRVLERAQQHGMAIESENVEDDNSIVLTLRVEEVNA